MRTFTGGLILVSGLLAMAGAAAGAEELPPARAGNLLFAMPEGWSRGDGEDGVTTLTAPGSPEGQYFQIRLLPTAPLRGNLKAHFAAEVADLRKKVEVAGVGEFSIVKSPGGVDIGMGLIAWKNPAESGQTIVTVLCLAQAGKDVHPILLVTNHGPLYTKHKQVSARFLDSIRLASRIILVPGPRPLTQQVVNELTDFVEWMIEVPMTQQQRQRMREILVAEWKTAKPAELDGVEEFQKARRQLAEMPPAKRELARQAMQPQALEDWRKQTDDLPRMIVEIYDAAHKPIAAGVPPLTRQASDAGLELLYFMACQTLGGQEVRPDATAKDEWARRMIAEYPKADAKTRQSIAQMPAAWAGVRYAWAELPEAKRREARESWAAMPAIQQLAQKLKSLRTEAAATAARGGIDFDAAMAKLQKNHANYQFMSNMLRMQHETNMHIIRNMSGSTSYTYRYVYR